MTVLVTAGFCNIFSCDADMKSVDTAYSRYGLNSNTFMTSLICMTTTELIIDQCPDTRTLQVEFATHLALDIPCE